jgi:pimeloyl-ACP methyl ester carboxylesterase
MTARWQTGTVACGGEEIYYEVTGDDDLPAIMLTHGAGSTHAAWFQQVPTLAANGFRVITWDCRGFGNSTFTSGVHSSAAAVADIAAVFDATGTPGAHLVGQSMGGWWVTAFTIANRDDQARTAHDMSTPQTASSCPRACKASWPAAPMPRAAGKVPTASQSTQSRTRSSSGNASSTNTLAAAATRTTITGSNCGLGRRSVSALNRCCHSSFGASPRTLASHH